MPNKLPNFLDNHKICIICEGNEEYEYLKRLKDLKVWNEQYVLFCKLNDAPFFTLFDTKTA